MGSGNSGLYSGAVLSSAFPGSKDYMQPGDPFIRYIKGRKDVDANGFYDIIAHGTANTMIIEHNGVRMEIDHRTAARLFKRDKNYPGKSIRLLSCDTGASKAGFAQNLANKLGVIVEAPTKMVWAYPSGRYIVAAPSKDGKRPDLTKRGKFIKFYPGGNKK